MHCSHTELYIHFTWATKKRVKSISPEWEKNMYQYIIKKGYQAKSHVLEVNGIENHIHVLIRASTEKSPSQLAHLLKGSSSHFINQNGWTKTRFEWQDGYGAFSVSPHDVEMIARYIRKQKIHHGAGTDKIELENTGEDGGASE